MQSCASVYERTKEMVLTCDRPHWLVRAVVRILYLFTLHLKLLYVKTRNVEYRFCASGVLRFPLDGDGLALSGQEVEVVVGILHGQNLLAVFATEVQAKHQCRGVACVGDDEVHCGLEHQSYIHLGNGHGVEFLG